MTEQKVDSKVEVDPQQNEVIAAREAEGQPPVAPVVMPELAPDPLQVEADALAIAFGIRVIEVQVRNVKIKIREFTPDDLHPLYSWLAEVRGLLVKTGQINESVAREMIQQAITSGVDILHVVTDGVVPKGAKLPMSVIGRLIDGIIEVNEDFFEVLPSLFRLLGGFPALLGQAPAAARGETAAGESNTASDKPDETPSRRGPREYPEPPAAHSGAGPSSSDGSGAEATA